MVLTKPNHHVQEDHRSIVEDEDAYYGEEIEDDNRDGMVIVLCINYNDFYFVGFLFLFIFPSFHWFEFNLIDSRWEKERLYQIRVETGSR